MTDDKWLESDELKAAIELAGLPSGVSWRAGVRDCQRWDVWGHGHLAALLAEHFLDWFVQEDLCPCLWCSSPGNWGLELNNGQPVEGDRFFGPTRLQVLTQGVNAQEPSKGARNG